MKKTIVTLACALIAPLAFAQTNSKDIRQATTTAAPVTGTLQGIVKDPKGHPIKSADIRIETKNGGRLLTAVKTDVNGRYISDGLPATTYRVTLVVNGAVDHFVEFVLDGILLKLAGSLVRVDHTSSVVGATLMMFSLRKVRNRDCQKSDQVPGAACAALKQ